VAICRALLEHKVLTTRHLHILFFRSLRRTQHRLSELKEAGIVSSFEPRRLFGQGRCPEHHILTELGAALLAHRMGVPRGDLPWVPDAAYADNRNLAHRMGTNAFFCALVEASRDMEGHCLQRWAPERKVGTDAGKIQPDGFGRYLHPGGACQFYLEYDRGTEGPHALTDKIEGYLAFASGWADDAAFPNVLVVVPDTLRERAVAIALAAATGRSRHPSGVAVYATSEELLTASGVLGAVWLAPGAEGDRLRLTELPAVDASPYDRGRCLGKPWTSPGASSRIFPLSATPRFPTRPEP